MNYLKENAKMVGLVGCVIGIIGCFLPFASALGYSASWTSGDGKIFIIAAIASGVLIYLNKEKLSLISSGIGALFFIIDFFKLLGTSLVSMKIGVLFIIVGLAGMLACPFLKKGE